eukprot:10799901-Ditylum_brightwellii.AAC.1
MISKPPQIATVTTAYKIGNYLSSSASVVNTTKSAPLTQDMFATFYASVPAHVCCTLGTLQTEDLDVQYWTSALENDRVIIAPDGSVQKERGLCDCHSAQISSYQSKLFGILAIYYLLHSILSYSKKTLKVPFTIHRKNKSVVCANNTPLCPGVLSHLAPDYDFITKINSLKSLGLSGTADW